MEIVKSTKIMIPPEELKLIIQSYLLKEKKLHVNCEDIRFNISRQDDSIDYKDGVYIHVVDENNNPVEFVQVKSEF